MEPKKVDGISVPAPSDLQKKRRYEAPRIISEELLEVGAASCGSHPGGLGKAAPCTTPQS